MYTSIPEWGFWRDLSFGSTDIVVVMYSFVSSISSLMNTPRSHLVCCKLELQHVVRPFFHAGAHIS